MTKDSEAPAVEPPRARIVSAARTLFYERGVHAVSVDQVAETAGSNKMTLYRHFASKDLLIAEWLRSAAEYPRRKWEAIEAAHPTDPIARLHGLVDMMVEEITNWDRGCPFSNSFAELPNPDHPGRGVIEEYFRFQRNWLERACRQAEFEDPEATADALYYFIRGTTVGLAIDDAEEFAKRERRGANAILKAAMVSARARPAATVTPRERRRRRGRPTV